MKLQINGNGAWKNVLEFDVARANEVEDAAAALSRAAGGLNLAVLDDVGVRRHLNSRGVFRALNSDLIDKCKTRPASLSAGRERKP